jgi:hypothetical protein
VSARRPALRVPELLRSRYVLLERLLCRRAPLKCASEGHYVAVRAELLGAVVRALDATKDASPDALCKVSCPQ